MTDFFGAPTPSLQHLYFPLPRSVEPILAYFTTRLLALLPALAGASRRALGQELIRVQSVEVHTVNGLTRGILDAV